MRKEYDFSKATKNPYAKFFKKQVTIRLDEATIKYFKNMADGECLTRPLSTCISGIVLRQRDVYQSIGNPPRNNAVHRRRIR